MNQQIDQNQYQNQINQPKTYRIPFYMPFPVQRDRSIIKR
jgi:hypothetical protein